MLDQSNIDSLLKDWYILNFVDMNPQKICDSMKEMFGGCLCVDTKDVFPEFLEAISIHKMDDFREKYCEADLLVMKMSKDDANKSTFQSELVFIFNVRRYHKRKTIVVTEERAVTYHFSNDDLTGLLRPYMEISDL